MRQDEEMWIKKMKEVFSEYSEPFPPDGWAKLEKELQPERRIYPLKRWGIAAAILILALSGVSIFFMNMPIADEIKYTTIPEQASVPDVPSAQPQQDLLSLDSQPLKALTESKNVNTYIPSKQLPESIEENEVTLEDINVENGTDNSLVENKNNIDEGQSSLKENVDENEPERHKPSGRDKLHLPVDSKETGRVSSKSTWAVGLAVNSGAASLSSSDGEYNSGPRQMMDAVSVPELSSNGLIVVPEDQTVILKDDLPYLVKSNQVIDAKHHQPITFGLTIRKGITERLSLESGVMYTLLSSDVKLASDPSTAVDQKLHYIGIPLKANWNFIDSRHFTLYASAGGAVEKCVYGKIGGNKNTVDALQFSLLGAIGAQYNATSKIGLYVEPGVSYFFDDGSDVETIRKDKSFNFNLQAGIRFTY